MECNFCPEGNTAAEYDGPTKFRGHPLAFMCGKHADMYATAQVVPILTLAGV